MASKKAKFPYGAAIDRAFTDAEYLDQLLAHPESALKEVGITLDEGVKVTAKMTGHSAGGSLSIEVENAKVDWAGSVHLVLHEGEA